MLNIWSRMKNNGNLFSKWLPAVLTPTVYSDKVWSIRKILYWHYCANSNTVSVGTGGCSARNKHFDEMHLASVFHLWTTRSTTICETKYTMNNTFSTSSSFAQANWNDEVTFSISNIDRTQWDSIMTDNSNMNTLQLCQCSIHEQATCWHISLQA